MQVEKGVNRDLSVSTVRQIILASNSRYRKALLNRLGLPFQAIPPAIDESTRDGEPPAHMVMRLARQKAGALCQHYPDALIIGSDQCAVVSDSVLGKPGNFDRAFCQLKLASGKTAIFHTGLCLLDTANGYCQIDDIVFKVSLRQLTDAQITHYLQKEKPYDCAGSFKAEGLGVALFERMEGDDPNALIGLPLIRLVSMLKNAGVHLF